MSKPLNVGMIGYGFMGRAHSNAYRQVGQFYKHEHRPGAEEDQGLCPELGIRVVRNRLAKADRPQRHRRHRHRQPEQYASRDRVGGGRGGEDDPVREAAGHDRGRRRRDGRRGREGQSAEYGVVQLPPRAGHFAGQAGRRRRAHRPAFHYRGTYLQDWTIAEDVPQGGAALWRLDAAVAGSGVTGDLLAHSIDTAEWLNGPISRVTAATETFVKERTHVETGKKQAVAIDDACMFLALFANGSMGTFESTRYARGRKNYNTFELNGERGSVFFDLEDPHILQYFKYADPKSGEKIESHLTGWQRVNVTNFEHPYMDKWWVPGCTIGYEHTFINALADFLTSLETGKPVQPDFRAGLRTQKVCDAVLASAKSGQWVEIS